jgi:hypothetical protein
MWISITPYVVCILIVGLALIGVVALRPKLFWPILIFVVVGTLGPKVQGYCLIDEYFTGCVLVGGLLAISVKAVSLRGKPSNGLNYLHLCLFSVMIIYMIVESIWGLFLWEDLRLIRWVIYYAMLGIIAFVTFKGDFPVPNARKTALIVSWSALLYFIAYLGQGFYAETFRGISRFATQGLEWAGSAGAVFPLVIAMPAAIFLLKDSVRYRRWLGLALILVSILVAYYYDSRVSYLVITAFLVFSPIVLGFRRVAPFLFLFLGILGYIYCFGDWGGFINEVQTYASRFFETVAAFWSPRVSDIGRSLHMQVGFVAVGASLATWLFGYGIHSHRFVIGPYLQELYSEIPGVSVKLGNIVRTEAFTALLVDTGFIGMLLLAANFLFTAFRLFVQKSPMRIILLLSLVITFLWMFVSDLQDHVLFYLMIMPSGLLALLGQHEAAEQPAKEADWQNAQPNLGKRNNVY